MVPLMLSAVTGAFLFLAEYVIRILLPLSLLLKTAAAFGCLPAVWIIRAFHWIFTMVRSIPAALVVTGHLEIWQVILIYGLELLVFIGYFRRKYVMIVLTALIVAFIAVVPRRPALGITMLDIGQGDSILVRCPDGYNILIDSGSSSDQKIASYTIKPALKYYGIAYLDGVIISHFDEDHISGIRDLLQAEYPIGCLLTGSPGPQDEIDENRRMILGLARKQGIPVRNLTCGDRFSLGSVSFVCLNPASEDKEVENKGLENKIVENKGVENKGVENKGVENKGVENKILEDKGLGDKRVEDAVQEEDRNARSLVLYMKWKQFDALFTGDIGEGEEKKIQACLQEYEKRFGIKRKEELSLYQEIRDGISFLKAAHHGSSHSSCREFLEFTRPLITGISAGRKNRYGHPGEQTLARLKKTGVSKVFCSSWGGAICLETDGRTIQAGYAGM